MAVSGSDFWLIEAPPAPVAAFPSVGALVIDAASEKVGCVIQAPKTGTIDRVLFATATVTTGATVDVRVETVSTTDGLPTGTLFGTNTNASKVIANGDDNTHIETTLTAGASVTRSDILALVVSNPAASFGNMQIAAHLGSARSGAFPYTCHFTASWAAQVAANHSVAFAVRYSDGAWYPVCPNALPVLTILSSSFASNSTPDERGLKFKFPWPVRVRGFWMYGDTDPANSTVNLYDSDGSAVLNSLAIDKDQMANEIARNRWYLFDDVHELAADTFYRLTLVPDTTTSVTLGGFTVGAAAYLDAAPCGQNFHYTERTDAGAWTDTTTQRPFMGLLLDGFDDGAGGGGGGGGGPLISGRLVR